MFEEKNVFVDVVLWKTWRHLLNFRDQIKEFKKYEEMILKVLNQNIFFYSSLRSLNRITAERLSYLLLSDTPGHTEPKKYTKTVF